jgi:hypothetical protein
MKTRVSAADPPTSALVPLLLIGVAALAPTCPRGGRRAGSCSARCGIP